MFQNYSTDDLARARVLGSSTIFEASKLPNCAVDPAIRAVWNGASVVGPAYPLECAPGDNLAIHVALEIAPKGSVLVVSTSGFVAGYWGEVLTVAAEAAGIAGLIIDGGVRDIAALTARRFPVFTRGISARGTIKASVLSVGRPIVFAGAPVAAGDLVVADDDGVVIIPAAEAHPVLEQSQERADKEAVMMRDLVRGETTLSLMGLSQWSRRDADAATASHSSQ